MTYNFNQTYITDFDMQLEINNHLLITEYEIRNNPKSTAETKGAKEAAYLRNKDWLEKLIIDMHFDTTN